MALKDFTGQNIKDTFQRVVQTDGTNFADGTGSIIPIALSTEISGAFVSESALLSGRITDLETASGSFSIRVTDLEDTTANRTFGHITASGNISASGDLIATNVNVGVPTSNNWGQNLEGSYFNNFNASTDVSEILRFVAGLLSSSAANPTPNTKTYSGLTENKTNTTTTSAPTGHIPNNHNITDVTYLIDNGFASIGGTIFPSKTIRTNTGYSISYTSNDSGTTAVSSSVDGDLFGLGSLNSGDANTFKVSGSHIFKFYRSQAAYNGNSETEISSSGAMLTNSSFGTSNGLTIGKIETANSAVIPAAFQDGKFVEVHGQNVVNWTTEALTSVSASGYYKIDTTIGIATGSQNDFTTQTASETIFWAPISSINDNIPSQTITASFQSVTALSLTSQSLSGAPYVTGGEWQYDATASGMFDPLYAGDSTFVISMAITDPNSNGTVDVDRKSGFNRLDISNGELGSSGIIRNEAGTFRSSGDIPHRQDSASVSVVYDITGTGNTIDETGFTDSVFNLKMRIRNRTTALNDQRIQNVPIHTAGTFGQPAASGSMGYFGGTNSSDATTTLIERFTTESYRRVISNSTSLTNAWNKTARLTLGDGGDLQVKPGYLVNPESANGYFYPTSGYNANHYKWYLREFDTGATSNKGTLTINLDPNNSSDLVTFDSTAANKIAVGVIFGSSTSTVFDAVKGNQSYGGSLNSTANGEKNPFSDAIDIKGDFSSITNSSGTLTLGLNNAGGQTINGTHDKIWLLIRYSGTPSYTLEKITVSTS